jgi:hypothetical protein
MEIELPRGLIKVLLAILALIGPMLLGIRVSPGTEDGHPLFLTPRLARLENYRREAHAWTTAMQKADNELSSILQAPTGDLFAQDSRVNQVYGQMQQTVDAIDQTQAPPTVESLHALIGQTARAYLDAAVLTASWISEPTQTNLQAAQSGLASAKQLFNQLNATPWIEAKP